MTKRMFVVSILIVVAMVLSSCAGGILSNENATPANETTADVQTKIDDAVKATIESLPQPTQEPTATLPPTAEPTATTPAATATSTLAPTPDATTLLANPPYTFLTQKDENGRNVTTMPGFDLGEYGGNDSTCTRTELDSIHIGEVVGSQSEKCLMVIEWSLKVNDQTIITGTYALAPGEWFYIPLAVAGQNDSPRIVGTAWYLPKNWNSHMFAADLASERDVRDGTISIVGLSPTDPWVQAIADAQ